MNLTNGGIFKTVIAYSSIHFDPMSGKKKGSAGEIASTCYQTASEIVGSDNVIYIDSDRPETWPQNPGPIDSLITRDSNVALQISHFKPKKILLIAVNRHVKTRQSLAAVAKNCGLPKEALDVTDGVYEVISGANLANKILVVGDGSTRNSYLKYGVASRDILPVTYHQEEIEFTYKPNLSNNTVLVHLGSLGFRKGLDKVLEFAKADVFKNSEMKMVITGLAVNDFWKSKIEEETNKGRLIFPGWVDIHTDEFRKILSDTKFALFPSREEGLSGAYLEIARTGIPVISTRNVGIETVPELTIFGDTIKELIDISSQIMNSDEQELGNLSKSQLNLLALIPNDGAQLKNAISRFLATGKIWPKVDVKLSVHNKKTTIHELISSWDKSAERLDNCEITVINDGSSDNSQIEIERAKSSSRNFNEFKSLWADDIFEVRSNNMALKIGQYDYAVIIQDDNFCIDYDLLPELIATIDKFRKVGIIGGLAGVNFFPINPKCNCKGPGQHVSTELEHYQRLDEKYDPALQNLIFEVDAVMRGPFVMSARALSDVGLLDERYAPLYNDDMDWCLRARANGWRVIALLGGVINNSESMSGGTATQKSIYTNAFEKNAKLFNSEWEHSLSKKYLRVTRNWQLGHEANQNRSLLVKFYLRALPNKIRMHLLIKYPNFSSRLRRIKHFIQEL